MAVSVNIEACKLALPLPALINRLGHGIPNRTMRCPFHDDSRNSFSVYKDGGRWYWKCFAGCGSGDEVNFIEKALGLNTAKAIQEYNTMAGQPTPMQQIVFKPKTIRPDKDTDNNIDPANWWRKLTPDEVDKINVWRGYKSILVESMNEAGAIGVYHKGIGFPVFGGWHYRVKSDGSWRYSKNAHVKMFWIVAPDDDSAEFNIFESQWDSMAYADVTGKTLNVGSSRGASNVKLVIDYFKNYKGTVNLWPQNDKPGHKWAEDILRGLTNNKVTCLIKNIPNEYKDLNDWLKSGNLTPNDINTQDKTLDGSVRDTTEAGTGATSPSCTDFAGTVPASNSHAEEVVTATEGQDGPPGDNPTRPDGADPGTAPLAALSDMLDKCVTFLERYVKFDEEWQPKLCALWAAATWVYDVFNYTPYLHIYSPDTNCGKSTLLKAVGKISRKPWTPIAGSEAALYMKVEQDKPTVLMDEVDAIWNEKEGHEAMRAILNAGYERGAMVPRAPRGVLVEYNVYCPKALAGIGRLPATIENRSIHVYLVRQPVNDKATRWRTSIVDDETKPIQDFFTAWVPAVHEQLALARPSMPDNMDGRSMDIIEPLLAVADLAGSQWAQAARDCAVEAFSQPTADSEATKLLRDIRLLFSNNGTHEMTARQMVEGLVVMSDDAPWAQWWERAIKNDQYSAPQAKLVKMLKGFHINPRKMKAKKYEGQIPEEITVKGYFKSDFSTAWSRFLAPIGEAKTMSLI